MTGPAARRDEPSWAVTMTATRPGCCAGCDWDIIPGDARCSASACARSARYRPAGPFRATSRLTVDAGRPIRAPISRYDS